MENIQDEIYSFIDSKYLIQDSKEGLIPRNGGNSQSIKDEKKAIFYSQGKEGAIVMYFEFLRQYNNLLGTRGDEALQEYASYQSGVTELSEDKLQRLHQQLEQINKVRTSKNFDEFMGDKLYLRLSGIDIEHDRQDAAKWKEEHPDDRMDYNYANSWTIHEIPADRIEVMTLQSATGTDVRTSQKDIIMYFLSKTNIADIERLGINDTTLGYIKDFSEEHRDEIIRLSTEYSLVPQGIQDFAENMQSQETEITTGKLTPNDIMGVIKDVKQPEIRAERNIVVKETSEEDKSITVEQ